MSVRPYRVEVVSDGSGVWVTNPTRFSSIEEAKLYGRSISRRWIGVTRWRIVDGRTGETIHEAPATPPEPR